MSDGAKFVGEFIRHEMWNGIEYNADGTVNGVYLKGEFIQQ